MALPTDAKAREEFPLFDYQYGYFPDAYLEEVRASWIGNEQHNPGERMHWARGKSDDHMNKAMRHLDDYGRGIQKDTDGCYHLAKAVWRIKARLQLDIEASRAAAAEGVPKPAPLRVVPGKRYVQRNGEIYGPGVEWSRGKYAVRWEGGKPPLRTADGRVWLLGPEDEADLVAEYVEPAPVVLDYSHEVYAQRERDAQMSGGGDDPYRPGNGRGVKE